ncbi:MAG: 50S ribosomal protein L15 [Candidatus Brocadiaceae bacterium]|nr:50S ribosomal protein L15 [Candidatus Brocadiaceae bacterium]
MNLSDIKATTIQRKRRKRVGRGRGSGTGKTSGKGFKGASSRSGYQMKRLFEGGQTPLYRRLPKRGFNNIFKKKYNIINIKDIANLENGTVVDLKKLKDIGLVKKELDGIKILGEGEIANSIIVNAHKFSKAAMQKIKTAGGEVKVLS